MVTTRDIIFSEGLLSTHPEEEIAAIGAHELAHLTEPRHVHRARLMIALGWFPLIFVRPAVHLFGPIAVTLLLLPIVLLPIYVRRLARQMEVRADSVASGNEQAVGAYARALERLYRNNHIPAVMASKRRAHPDLYDRLLAAGITPHYPRPKAPRTFDWSSGLVLFLFVAFLMAFIAFKVCTMPGLYSQ
jgi:Zn-dependent protease with chaperone function